MGRYSRLAATGAKMVGQVYWRQPTDPLANTPQAVVEAICGFGGTNEYGEPLWRIISADQHLVQRSGEWHEFDPGDNQVDFTPSKRGGGLDYKTKPLKPLSVKVETRWIPRWPCEGWILERWFPANCYGTEEAWKAVLSSDNRTPMMGPYPHRGDYWMMDGPWDFIPDTSAIRRTISAWENSVKHMHGKIDKALFDRNMEQFMKLLDTRKAEKELRLTAKVKKLREETLSFVMNNPKLEAYRNRILNSRGMTSHY